MTDDISFSIKGAGKIILFFFCSFILSVFLGVLSMFMLSILGIIFQIALWNSTWIVIFISTIPVFVAYLISGSILRLYTKNWSILLYFLVAIICGVIHYLVDFEIVYSEYSYSFDETHIFIQSSISYGALVLGVFLGAVVIGNLLADKTDLAKILPNIIPNIMKASVFILFVFIFIGYTLLRKEFDSELYVADKNLFSRIMEYMDDQNIAFEIRIQENGIEYIYFHVSDIFEVKKLVSMLKGMEGGFEKRGLCKSNINDQNAILGDFVENNIDHIIHSFDVYHCFYWLSEDASKVSEYIEAYEEDFISRSEMTIFPR